LSFYWCRAWRKALGINLIEFSKISGVCVDTLSRFENGKRISRTTQVIIDDTVKLLRERYFKNHSVVEIKCLLDHPAFERAVNMSLHASREKQHL
jgi:transcriptional regulator with XRE-family HTH domain